MIFPTRNTWPWTRSASNWIVELCFIVPHTSRKSAHLYGLLFALIAIIIVIVPNDWIYTLFCDDARKHHGDTASELEWRSPAVGTCAVLPSLHHARGRAVVFKDNRISSKYKYVPRRYFNKGSKIINKQPWRALIYVGGFRKHFEYCSCEIDNFASLKCTSLLSLSSTHNHSKFRRIALENSKKEFPYSLESSKEFSLCSRCIVFRVWQLQRIPSNWRPWIKLIIFKVRCLLDNF